jgi:hypothetical protein
MYEFKWEGEGVCWKYSDTVSGEDVVRANSEIYGDARFDHLKYIIIDLLDVREIDLGDQDVSATTSFAVRANPKNPHVKVAFVATHDELCGLVRAYIEAALQRLPHSKQQLFTDEADARRWIAS